jgi:hypothetical protein
MIQAASSLTPPPPVVFPLTYPKDIWECPYTGVPVPKRLIDNVALRVRIYEETSARKHAMWMAACARSPLLFLNLFWWSYRPKMVCEDGVERSAGTVYEYEGQLLRVPPADTAIVTWPAQDVYVDTLNDVAHNGGSLMVEKGREQGATVLSIGYIAWAMIFWRRFSALVASRKEELVDSNKQEALLVHLDNGIKRLPAWMFQHHQYSSTHMFRRYEAMETEIVGESANEDLGQSSRKNLAFVDEAARFPYGEKLQTSIDSVAAAQVFCSTHNGPGTAFARMLKHARTPAGRKHVRICTLAYWDNPTKGRGRVWTIDEDGTVTGIAGSGYWETPAFRVAFEKAESIRVIRENWLLLEAASGSLVLDSNAITRQRSGARKPDLVGTLHVEGMFDGDGLLLLSGDQIANAKKTFRPDPKGKIKLWRPLVNGEPSRDRNYVHGWDFSLGVEGSNTPCMIMDRETGEIVASFASSAIAPDEAAALAIALGSWFGGQLGWAFIIFESNGPGLTFGSTITRLGYPYIYHQRAEETDGQKPGTRWGWWSTGNSKEILFGQLDRALRSNQLIVYEEEALDDAAAWIYDDYGRIVCGTHRDASTGAQARHGDRAIALGLCVMGRREAPKFVPTRPRYREGTFGQITQAHLASKKVTQSGW